MDKTQTCIKRREILTRGAGLAGASLLGIVICAPSRAAEKSSKTALLYQGHPHDGQHCGDCKYFSAGSQPNGGTCALVEGMIDSNGWCMAFSPRG
jgi:hypothetical protein